MSIHIKKYYKANQRERKETNNTKDFEIFSKNNGVRDVYKRQLPDSFLFFNLKFRFMCRKGTRNGLDYNFVTLVA